MNTKQKLLYVSEIMDRLKFLRSHQEEVRDNATAKIAELTEEMKYPSKNFLHLWRKLGGVSINRFTESKKKVRIGKTSVNEHGGVVFLFKKTYEPGSEQGTFFTWDGKPELQELFSRLEEWGIIEKDESYVCDGVYGYGFCRRTDEGWVRICRLN